MKIGLYFDGQNGKTSKWVKLSKKIWINQAIKELENKILKENGCWILNFKEILSSLALALHKIAARIKLPKIAPKIEWK